MELSLNFKEKFMTVDQFLEKHLECSIEPINVDDHITDDSFDEITDSTSCVCECEDGTVFYNPENLSAYYHLNEEPEDMFHFITIYDDDDDFDDEDF